MVSDTTKADIMKLRGLGYTQKEIAKKLKLTQATINYHLNQINQEAQTQGDDNTYIKTLTNGYTPQILKTIKTLQHLNPNKNNK